MTTTNEDANKVRCLNCGAYIGWVCPVCDHEFEKLTAEGKMVLAELADASEEAASSDPDMPSHKESGLRFDAALDAARAFLKACSS